MAGFPLEEHSPFCRFAIHLLSISANSASCERLFSVYGNILTKLRNRMYPKVLTGIGEVKLNVCSEHVRKGTKGTLRKRTFGPPISTSTGEDHSDFRVDSRRLHSSMLKDIVQGKSVRSCKLKPLTTCPRSIHQQSESPEPHIL